MIVQHCSTGFRHPVQADAYNRHQRQRVVFLVPTLGLTLFRYSQVFIVCFPLVILHLSRNGPGTLWFWRFSAEHLDNPLDTSTISAGSSLNSVYASGAPPLVVVWLCCT